MIQKIALVILTVVVVVLLFSKPCNENRIRREKRYSLYMVVDSSERVHSDALVLLDGKEIGVLNEINPNGNKKVLDLRIYDASSAKNELMCKAYVNLVSTLCDPCVKGYTLLREHTCLTHG